MAKRESTPVAKSKPVAELTPVADKSVSRIRAWAEQSGFQEIGFTSLNDPVQLKHLRSHIEHLSNWLELDHQGEMRYMQRNKELRARPGDLFAATATVISLRMNYLPADTHRWRTLRDKSKAYVSRYALGRDYHKLIRRRLVHLVARLQSVYPDASFRVFTDSAPVLEKALAESAGLGWIGKNTLLLNRKAGSWFFLSEIFTDLKFHNTNERLPTNHCGSCTGCIDVCPTGAIIAPYQLDARKCISYLTIELKGPIPPPLRPLMGNRIFGCDDCQLVCPWNRFARNTGEKDFKPRHGLDDAELVDLFRWSEEEFLKRTEGSAIRRTGYLGWLRNLAVALGNAPANAIIISALRSRLDHPSEMLREHIDWALRQQSQKLASGGDSGALASSS